MPPVLEGGFPTITEAASSASTSITKSTAVGAGSNRLLLAMCDLEAGTNVVSGITFNGTETFTKHDHAAGNSFARVEVWWLIAPSNVTANVVMSYSNVSGTNAALVLYVFDGVDQTTPLRAAAAGAKQTGNSTVSSATVPTWVSGDYTLDMLSIDSIGHAPAPNDTNVADFAAGDFGAGTNQYICSHKTDSGLSSWTWTTAAAFAYIVTAIRPFVVIDNTMKQGTMADFDECLDIRTWV